MQTMQLAALNAALDVYGALPDVGTDINPRLEIRNASDTVVFAIDLNATDAIAAAATATDHAEAAFNAPDGYANWGAVTDKDGETVGAETASYGVIFNGAGAGAECFRLSVGLAASGKDIEMSSLTCQQGIFTTFTATPKLTLLAGSYA